MVILIIVMLAGAWVVWYAENMEEDHRIEADELARKSLKEKKKKSTRNWL